MIREWMVASIALACAAGVQGQTGVLYAIKPGASLIQDRCVGPCLCPYHRVTGSLAGTFTLTERDVGPIFTNYRVTGVDLLSLLGLEPVSIRGEGVYSIGGEVGLVQRMTLSLISTSPPEPLPVTYESGVVPVGAKNPFPRIEITIQAPIQGCTQNAIVVVAAPVPCQADCDASGGLTANDLVCFINKFSQGDPYANCDGSTQAPILTANDFACYVNHFAVGCS